LFEFQNHVQPLPKNEILPYMPSAIKLSIMFCISE